MINTNVLVEFCCKAVYTGEAIKKAIDERRIRPGTILEIDDPDALEDSFIFFRDRISTIEPGKIIYRGIEYPEKRLKSITWSYNKSTLTTWDYDFHDSRDRIENCTGLPKSISEIIWYYVPVLCCRAQDTCAILGIKPEIHPYLISAMGCCLGIFFDIRPILKKPSRRFPFQDESRMYRNNSSELVQSDPVKIQRNVEIFNFNDPKEYNQMINKICQNHSDELTFRGKPITESPRATLSIDPPNVDNIATPQAHVCAVQKQ